MNLMKEYEKFKRELKHRQKCGQLLNQIKKK